MCLDTVAPFHDCQGINDSVGEFVGGVGEVGEVGVVAGESKRSKRSMGCNLLLFLPTPPLISPYYPHYRYYPDSDPSLIRQQNHKFPV
jgi:hypothetical protein